MDCFAENLKRIREEKGLTQEQLAQGVNVTRQAVSRWEQGRTEPDIATCVRLAEVLEIPPEELMLGKKTAAYKRFQRPYLTGCVCTAMLVAVLFVLQLAVFPRWEKQVHTTYEGAFAYFWVCRLLIPMLQPALLGALVVSFGRLFYKVELQKPWKAIALLCGLLLLLPALAVLADDLLAGCVADWSAVMFHWLYIWSSKVPPLQTLLFRVFPFLTGALLTIRCTKPA